MFDEIFIRADANESIGIGHIMRCISIANGIIELGGSVTFLVADDETEKFVREKGFNVITLKSVWNNLELELDSMLALIRERHIKRILVDSYYVTEFYLSELRKETQVFYLDDRDEFVYPVDCLINYNIYSEDKEREKRYRDKGLSTRFLIGTLYAPLRLEYQGIPKRSYKGIKKVLITSGGTDNHNVIGKVLEKLKNASWFREKEYYCVIGSFNKHKNELMAKYGACSNVHLLYNITNMKEYMLMSDVCITAGGTTIYELCACGTPAIMYTLADNQIPCAKTVSRLELIPWVGDVRYEMESCFERIEEEIIHFESTERWEKVSSKMQQYIDGNGAMRIAAQFVQ